MLNCGDRGSALLDLNYEQEETSKTLLCLVTRSFYVTNVHVCDDSGNQSRVPFPRTLMGYNQVVVTTAASDPIEMFDEISAV